MVKGLWNYAIKVAPIERAASFYVEALGARVAVRGDVLGCAYALLRIGDTRIILFEKAPYEDLLGRTLPQASCTTSTRSMISTTRSRGCAPPEATS